MIWFWGDTPVGAHAKARADIKVLLLTYKALHGLAPTYLSNVVLPYIPTHMLRSQDAGLLTVPRISKQTANVIETDSFSTFKSLLKTHLFSGS